LEPEDLGVIAVQLALSFPEWVRRRRFVVSYVDDTTIQQRMSIDFQLPGPEWFWSTTAPQPGDKIYVPIYLPEKDTLDQFTAFDENGRRLTMLPTADNGALAVAGLLPLVRALAAERLPVSQLDGMQRKLREELVKIVMAPKRPGSDPVVEVLEPALAAELGTVLNAEDETKAVVRDLARGFLMLVPVTYEPDADRLIKAEWDVPNYWHGKRGGNRLALWAQSGLASIGWADKRQHLPALQIGWSRSTHVEIVAPADVQMSAVSLEAEQYDPATKATVRTVRTVYNKPRATINVAPRVPFNPFEKDRSLREASARQLLQARGDTGAVDIRFRSPASGVLVAATVASAMLTALIWVAGEHLAILDRQTFSAVLLVFPAILAAYLLRQGEHDFARRLLVGVRLCGLGVAVCSVAVSAILGVAPLTREARQAVGSGSQATTRHLTCVARNAPIRGLACLEPAAVAPRVTADPATRTWISRLAVVASLLSGVLGVGLLRTWLWSDLRNRKKTEEHTVDSRGRRNTSR
jgi:hypothetical protein